MSRLYVPPVLAVDYDQYESLDTDISVVGSLKKHAAFWKRIDAPEHIIHIVEHGYAIPLNYLPPTMFLRNNKSALDHADFVRVSIDDLLHKGAIQELEKAPRIVNPLTVAEKDRKLRLVLDCRYINKRVLKKPCKIEGAETFQKYLADAKYLFGFDLKAGYHHIDVVSCNGNY